MTDSAASRRAAIAKVKVGAKALGLEDDGYRDLLAVVTGKRSAGEMGEGELGAVIEHMGRLGAYRVRRGPARAGRRRLAPGSMAGKARALWLALYHLGEVVDPSEKALAAFARRMTKVEALEWLSPGEMGRVIEGLKAWAARAGVAAGDAGEVARIDEWRARAGLPGDGAVLAPKVRLLQAQWRRLILAGALRPEAGLGTWLLRHGASAPWLLTAGEADAAVEALGAWVRRVREAAGPSPG